VSLSAGTTKLASITQNNHVYEHTAEGPTPEVSLNVRSPYRRQKRDLSIIRSSFRRPHTGIEVPTIIPTTLPSFRSHPLLPTFLRSTTSYFLPCCDHTDYQTTHTHSANQNALDLPCLGMVNNQPIRSALDFHDPRHGKSPTNQNTRDQQKDTLH